MEFDSCISGIDDNSCCDSDVDTGHGCDDTCSSSGAKSPRD